MLTTYFNFLLYIIVGTMHVPIFRAVQLYLGEIDYKHAQLI